MRQDILANIRVTFTSISSTLEANIFLSAGYISGMAYGIKMKFSTKVVLDNTINKIIRDF